MAEAITINDWYKYQSMKQAEERAQKAVNARKGGSNRAGATITLNNGKMVK